MRALIAVVVLLMSLDANAWKILGTPPLSSYELQVGTYAQFKTAAGSVRYFLVEETTICKEPKSYEVISPIYEQQPGLYKKYKLSATQNKYYPISVDDQCPVEPPPPPPPPPSSEFVGVNRLWVNPSTTEPNDCLWLVMTVGSKLPSGKHNITYTIHDGASYVNGARACSPP